MSEERVVVDLQTAGGDWFAALLRFLEDTGHPDDVAAASAVLALPSWRYRPEVEDLRETLREREGEGRRLLGELERVGWTYHRSGIGRGILEPIGGHPAHGGGRGRRANYVTSLVWTICYAKELVARRALDEPNPAWVRYRVDNTQELRDDIASRYRSLLPAELLTDDAIGSAVNSWLKREGRPPPWLSPAE